MTQWHIDLILYKAYAELRGEITRHYLGFAWWLIEPVMYMAAFYLVFGVVFERSSEHFVAFLLVGLVVWKWFDVGVRQSMSAIDRHSGLISQVYIPKYLFPLITVASVTIKFSIIFSILVVFLLFYGVEVTRYWLLLPGVILLQLLFLSACAMVVAAWVPLLGDIRPVIENGMMMLFFLSGIFFDIGQLNEPLKSLFELNPMTWFLAAFRLILIDGVAPSLSGLTWVLSFTLLFGVIGLLSLRHFDKIYPKVL